MWNLYSSPALPLIVPLPPPPRWRRLFYEKTGQIRMLFSVQSHCLVFPMTWIMKDIHLVYLSIKYLLLVRCIWELFIIAAPQEELCPSMVFVLNVNVWWRPRYRPGGVSTCLSCFWFYPLLMFGVSLLLRDSLFSMSPLKVNLAEIVLNKYN